jgi:hypothetical protein
MKSSIFWDITLCSPLKVNRRCGGTSRLHLQGPKINQARNQRETCLPPEFTLVSCLAYSSTLKMEATYSSETSVDFRRTTWRYIPEDRTLQNGQKITESRKSFSNITQRRHSSGTLQKRLKDALLIYSEVFIILEYPRK